MTITLPRPPRLHANGVAPPRPRWWRRLPRAARWGALIVALLLVLAVVLRLASPVGTQTAADATPVAAQRLIAHGTVQPVSQARVGTLAGGVLLSLAVDVGQTVNAQAEVARVRGASGAGGVEVLTAPFSGTVTGLVAHVGDTLAPGATVVMVADLSRLQVETTDVDEFLINHVHPGDVLTLEVEALDRRQVSGRVDSVGLQPQSNAAGDQQYPVTIDLGGTQPDVRPGMTVRITLPS